MTHAKTAMLSISAAIIAAAITCCATTGTEGARKATMVACAELDTLESLAVAVETGSGAKPDVVQATHTAFAALRAACITSGLPPAAGSDTVR